MLSTKVFQTDSLGLPTLLNYAAMVKSGVMLGKDGSLTAAFECEGLDIASATPAQRNYQAETLNTILTQHFGGGWVSHHELIRKPAAAYPDATASDFPDPISRGIEAENRANFLKEGNHFESTNILVVRYKSPSHKRTELLPEEKLGPTPDVLLTEEEHQKNNLPDVLKRWSERNGTELENPRTAQSFCIPKKDIEVAGYDLSLNRYKEVAHQEAEYEPPKQIIEELKALEKDIAEGLTKLEVMVR